MKNLFNSFFRTRQRLKTLVLTLVLAAFIGVLAGCNGEGDSGGQGGDDTGDTNVLMTAFSFLAANNNALDEGVTGIIDGTAIYVFVPEGTDVTSLKATFESSGTSVSVNGVEQISGATGNYFTDPMEYIVHGSDQSTVTYTVTVSNGDTAQFSLTAPDSQAKDFFGVAVAMDSGRAIVGASKEDGGTNDPAMNAGAAYVFELSDATWLPTAALRASDMAISDGFGHALDISGDYAIVGAYQEDGGDGDPSADAGAAYIFERGPSGEWLQQSILHASDAASLDYFGVAVAISGDTAIVGAYQEDGGAGDPETYAGAVYVFELDPSGDWLETTILHASDMLDNNSGDYFGYAVDIDGKTAIVGAYGAIYNDGAAYIFEQDDHGAWNETAILNGSDIGTNNQYRFGYAVAISGNSVVIGTPAKNTGAAYVFQKETDGTWTEQAILTGADASTDDGFGFAVAINGDNIVIGAVGEDGGPGYDIASAGAVYQFTRDTGGNWSQARAFHAPVIKAWDLFGVTVDISDGTIISGSFMADGDLDDPVLNQGMAYIY